MTDHYLQRDAAARTWKQAGGAVVGYFADDVPVALIEAAGFLPYRVAGDPAGDIPAAMARGPIDVRADRLAYVNSWVCQIAAGHLDFIDHFIISNSRKHILQLHERLLALKRPPSLCVLDRAMGDSFAASEFNHRQIIQLGSRLEGWAGAPITDSAMAAAVARYNRRASALRRFASLRETMPARLAGSLALRTLIAIRRMRCDDAAALLESMIASAATGDAVPGLPLFIGGSAQDNDAIYRAIEQAGGNVIAESHGWGPALIEQDIGDGDPFAAISAHYHHHPDFVVPLAESVAKVKQRVSRTIARRFLTCLYSADEAPLWEAPSEHHALDIPATTLADLPYTTELPPLCDRFATLMKDWQV
ncbi:MAG: 2-hydroxyacyl-CoA dehydratase [Gammaproteobacteria bacterium]|nr:2-hydroxyacyl-CoA dehydratase [Gammaproteobacteria bacterium]